MCLLSLSGRVLSPELALPGAALRVRCLSLACGLRNGVPNDLGAIAALAMFAQVIDGGFTEQIGA